ncbi:MAG: hypothetical protein GEV12_05285 [Micromonosporaceae bacterium]|nr:hypothetical protein [Micromonosporaceae bacterium]
MDPQIATFQSFITHSDATPEENTNAFGETRKVDRYFTREPGPYGFLVTMPRRNVINPHFHHVDQFQLFYGSPGANYKGAEIAPDQLLLHYADAYSTYGPIHSGEQPLEFFTLRARLDRGIGYIPKDRDRLVRTSRHRNIYRDHPLAPGPDTPALDVIIEPDADGIAAYRLRGQPGEIMSPPSAAGTGGQYCLLVNGAVTYQDRQYGPRSLAWIGPDTPAPSLVADPDRGADLIVMQFPKPPNAS